MFWGVLGNLEFGIGFGGGGWNSSGWRSEIRMEGDKDQANT